VQAEEAELVAVFNDGKAVFATEIDTKALDERAVQLQARLPLKSGQTRCPRPTLSHGFGLTFEVLNEHALQLAPVLVPRLLTQVLATKFDLLLAQQTF
jgi:hypothetical protein